MRNLLVILPLLLAAAPSAAQGIVVPVRCHGACAPDRLPNTFALVSVKAWASVGNAGARTSVDHAFLNETADTTDAAFFFPLPADATLYSVSVVDADLPAHDNNALLLYNQWTAPDEARWIAEGLVRDRRVAALRAYTGTRIVHVAVRAIPPGARRHLQIQYTQPPRREDGRVHYRYPLSFGAAAAPIGELTLGMQVETEAGFVDLRSPSHAVDVQWGTESAPCPPQMACGFRGVPSERKRVVRLEPGVDARRRDFELVYTPREAAPERTVSNP